MGEKKNTLKLTFPGRRTSMLKFNIKEEEKEIQEEISEEVAE